MEVDTANDIGNASASEAPLNDGVDLNLSSKNKIP